MASIRGRLGWLCWPEMCRSSLVCLGTALACSCAVGATGEPGHKPGALGMRESAVPDPFPRMARAYAVEMNGALLWQRNAHQRLPLASLTKLMTAILVVEQLEADAPVSVSRNAAQETGSRLGLKAGQTYTMQALLAATLMVSANDACRALADQVGGTQARFVERMNARAQQWGMENTRFTNACGHDASGHYSSVSDLRVLAHRALAQPLIAAWAAKAEARITTLDGKQSFALRNSNALIGRYAPASGLKTGTTAQAGKCLIAYARKGDAEVLLVMLHSADRWWDAVDVLELAFARTPPSP